MKPWVVISTNDANNTLGEGDTTRHRTLLAACNEFVHCEQPFKALIFDDGHVARELDEDEQRLLEHVAGMLGKDIERI